MTWHEDAAREESCRNMEHEATALAVSSALRRLRHSERDWYVDMIFQKHARAGRIKIHDAYCFAYVDGLIHSGLVRLCRIEVGSQPYPDKMKVENNQRLRDLPVPFRAEFVGGYGDSDGRLSWDDEIRVVPVPCLEDGCPSKSVKETMLRPGSCPLEVGFTDPSRTWGHLAQDGRLARWPYGSNYIYIMEAAGYRKGLLESLLTS